MITSIVYSNDQLTNIFTKSHRGPRLKYICNKFGAYDLYYLRGSIEYHNIFYGYSIEYPMDYSSLFISFLVFYSLPFVFYLVSFLLSSFIYKYVGHVSYSFIQ